MGIFEKEGAWLIPGERKERPRDPMEGERELWEITPAYIGRELPEYRKGKVFRSAGKEERIFSNRSPFDEEGRKVLTTKFRRFTRQELAETTMVASVVLEDDTLLVRWFIGE